MKSLSKSVATWSLLAWPLSALAQGRPNIPGSYYIVFGGGTAFGLLLAYLWCKYRCAKEKRSGVMK